MFSLQNFQAHSNANIVCVNNRGFQIFAVGLLYFVQQNDVVNRKLSESEKIMLATCSSRHVYVVIRIDLLAC